MIQSKWCKTNPYMSEKDNWIFFLAFRDTQLLLHCHWFFSTQSYILLYTSQNIKFLLRCFSSTQSSTFGVKQIQTQTFFRKCFPNTDTSQWIQLNKTVDASIQGRSKPFNGPKKIFIWGPPHQHVNNRCFIAPKLLYVFIMATIISIVWNYAIPVLL